MKNKLLFITLLSCCGCAINEHPAITSAKEQYQSLLDETSAYKVRFDKRIAEIEESYSVGEIDKSTYLVLKNNLEQERTNYSMDMQRRGQLIKIESDRKINSRY